MLHEKWVMCVSFFNHGCGLKSFKIHHIRINVLWQGYSGMKLVQVKKKKLSHYQIYGCSTVSGITL